MDNHPDDDGIGGTPPRSADDSSEQGWADLIDGLAQQVPLTRAEWAQGATETDLADLEARLSIPLPPGYRQFLTTINGGPLGLTADRFLAAAEVGWLRDLAPHIIDEWELTDDDDADPEPDRSNYDLFPAGWFRLYLRETLLISQDDGEGVYLLNPKVIADDGEWEAWFLADWVPGAERAVSLRALLQAGLDGSR